MTQLSRILIVAIVALLVIGASGVQPAQAAVWQLSDSFDVESNWVITNFPWGSPSAHIFTAPSGWIYPPRTGQKYAYIYQGNTPDEWGSIGRSVSLTPFLAGRTLNCAARIYARFGTSGNVNKPWHVKLEVIDSATWTYIALKEVDLWYTYPVPWVAVTTANWIPPRKNIFVRIVNQESPAGDRNFDIDVDDMLVSCQYY